MMPLTTFTRKARASPYTVAGHLEEAAELIRSAGELLDLAAKDADAETLARIEAVEGSGAVEHGLAKRLRDLAAAIEREEDDRLAGLEAEFAEANARDA